MNRLEHVNITVSNPAKTAQILCELFSWEIRWSGEAKDGGHTIHVGESQNGESYLALYEPIKMRTGSENKHDLSLNLNHIAVKVDDLNATEQRAIDLHLKPYSYGNYEPGERFYLDLPDQLEIEIVSYANA